MPKVTSCPARAAPAPASTAARKAAASGTTWSEGATSISASGSVLSSHSAAASTAGAVLRPSGSISTAPGSIPAAASCSVTMKRKSDPVSTSGAAKPGPESRSAEAWNSVVSPVRGTNCFG